MKKSYLSIVFLALISSLYYSCDSDVQELTDETNSTENTIKINDNSDDSSSKIFSLCEIDGPTSGCPNETVTYTYSTELSMQNITWSVTSGNLTLISGQGTNTATFKIGRLFSGGWVRAYGSGSPDCFASAQILRCRPSGNNSCSCPTPVIDDRVCVSGGHPHWRFQVDGINSRDKITWSINHGKIHSNPNQSYVIIEPNSSSVAGFTVYCKVERTCRDGSKKVRTAYYTNYYGKRCGTGTTGYVGNCRGGNDM